MTRVKLNLVSGSVQEREVVTAFTFNNVKYIIFDGESNGSMGLPIILVSKESMGKVVGITDAEEWKNTKECLKKIISGETVEYASVASELKADDIYYRQLTLPIASFDILKSSYAAPSDDDSSASVADQTPVFEPITPEDITGGSVPNIEPVAPSEFSAPAEAAVSAAPLPTIPEVSVDTPSVSVEKEPETTSEYEELKKEFLLGAEELFNSIYEKLNH